jgi:hypothetical protein
MKIRTILASTALVVGLLVVPASPAQAAWPDCPANYFCQFNNLNGSGTMWRWTALTINDQNGVQMHSGNNNNASSWYNRTAWRINIFDQSNCTYQIEYLNPGDIKIAESWDDNKASSIAVQGETIPC